MRSALAVPTQPTQVLMSIIGASSFASSPRTRIRLRPQGLFVKFSPFHRSFKRIELERVPDVEAKTYSPVMQHGGWGIRYRRGGKAYNVSGKKGVMVTFNNAKTLLIGSQKPEELEVAIKSVWQSPAHQDAVSQGNAMFSLS